MTEEKATSKLRKLNLIMIRDISIILTIGVVLGTVIMHLSVSTPLANQLSSMETQVSQLQYHLIGKEAQIEDLQNEVENKNNTINELQIQIEGDNATICDLESEIALLYYNITTLKSQIEEKDSLISNLQQQLLARDNTISNLQQLIVNLESEIVYLKQIEIDAWFSPKGGCEATVINWINRANSTIHILMYSFSSEPISDALIDAHSRGIEVKVVLEEDRVNSFSKYDELDAAGIEIYLDQNPRKMNNKVMIVDSKMVLTGSYDWTNDSENFNNENLIVINDFILAELFEEVFDKVWIQSIT